jgi:RNA polymerase sigma-70 factor (ECF subfamily)
VGELELVVREEWGRLLSLLVARFRRLDLAEDGLAEAVEAAARTWPTDGVPHNPAAWLLTTARRKVLDRLRSEAVAAKTMPLLAVEAELTERAHRVMVDPGGELLDERLRLVLLCAHPRLSREASAALTLRLVLGVATADIARLFLVSDATMAARLTRARKKVATGSFDSATGTLLQKRVHRAADVAYLAFTAAYAPGSGADVLRPELASEAIRLARVLRSLLMETSDRSEIDALLALMLLQHARRDARVHDGALVLLPDQDRRRWRYDEIQEAIELLTPLTGAPPAPYLLQALVAAEHAVADRPEDTAWERIVARYDELLTISDTPVVRLNRAVAVAETSGPRAGLAALAEVTLPGHRLPAVRAELLARVGETEAALEAYDAAIARCRNAAEQAHLRARRASCASESAT